MNRKWDYKKIGDICVVERGGSPRPINDYITDDVNGINWIKIGDADDSMYITHTEQKIKLEGARKSRYVQSGDFLLSNSMSFGKPYILKIDGCIHDGWLVLRDKDEIFDKRFLYYYLSSPTTYNKFKQMAVGGVVNNLNSEMVRKVTVPIPSMPEQLEIVERLDAVNELFTKEKKQLEQYDALVKSRFVEMFGDTVTNSMKWEEHYLDEYIKFLTSGSRGWAQYFVDEENELFITIKNVKNNHISLEDVQYINAPDNKEAERTKVEAGDLLISITADLGRTGVIDEEIANRGAYINQHLSLVRLEQKKINPLYVSYFLETEGGKRQFRSKNQNGVKAGLNFEAIKSLKILVPPLEKQNEYLDFVHQTDKLKVANNFLAA